MKKLLTITTTIALALISAALVQAKVLPETVERQTVKNLPVYLNVRVKQMCAEWPSCQEWVAARANQDDTFRVADTEVERWVKKWESNQFGSQVPVWEHRFYVKTLENGQTKSYLFSRNRSANNGYTYHSPVLMTNKFPGHPIPGNPSQHTKWLNKDKWSPCESFPGCVDWMHRHSFGIDDVVVSQYITDFDAQGEAIWAYKLYVRVSDSFSFFNYYFRASQIRHNGSYTYSAPKETKIFPKYPEYPF